ncbi:MAG: hypothetical protein JJU27_10425 [Gammaproteobacteria bacterium]|nr:hypothetical protein [Gammaproteobacteria bacterium]
MLAGIIPGKGQDAEATGDDRLLELYWNRAAVKKELANLRRERYELLEKLRESEAGTQRVAEQLATLEGLLADTDTAATAITHFQLRHLWKHCAQRIRQFVDDVAEKQMRRERDHLETDFRQRQARKHAEIEPSIRALESEISDQAERARALERLIAEMPFWRWGRRRALKLQFSALGSDQAARQAELEALVSRRNEIQSEVQPEYPGLSAESRRLLNLAALALAQELVLFFDENDLARRARAAFAEDVRNADFGTREDAQRLSRQIEERMAALAAQRQLTAAVKRRTDYLRSRVEYRRDDETIPLARSLERITRDPARGSAGGTANINVLAEEYWDIYGALR